MTSISIFGSTGSVGENTIKVLEAQNQDYDIEVLTANRNVTRLAEQARAVKAKNVVISDKALYNELKDLLANTDVKIHAGHDALNDAAQIKADWTMAAIVGMAGLEPLMQAIKRGGKIAIANKEPLVAAGEMVIQEAKKSGATLLPIDSEHNAVFQVFDEKNRTAIQRIILTASGGPFRQTKIDALKSVGVEDALNHPTWDMGAKISIDSATMMNKALEVIEAKWLFDVLPEQIDVMVHPQSIIHSMVEYTDGSVLAQMGASDMCTPITYALGWPDRLKSPGQRLDLHKIAYLKFEEVDHDKFPTVNMAYDCLKDGQKACITLNAANEIAVEAFLSQKIAFLDIYKLIKDRLNHINGGSLNSLDDILAYDQKVRTQTKSAILGAKAA